MNRAERRRGGWAKLNPKGDFDALGQSVGENGRNVMMAMLRQLAGPDAPFDDREFWNGIAELINAGLLNVYFRFSGGGIEVRPEFLTPPQNDHDRRHGGLAA